MRRAGPCRRATARLIHQGLPGCRRDQMEDPGRGERGSKSGASRGDPARHPSTLTGDSLLGAAAQLSRRLARAPRRGAFAWVDVSTGVSRSPTASRWVRFGRCSPASPPRGLVARRWRPSSPRADAEADAVPTPPARSASTHRRRFRRGSPRPPGGRLGRIASSPGRQMAAPDAIVDHRPELTQPGAACRPPVRERGRLDPSTPRSPQSRTTRSLGGREGSRSRRSTCTVTAAAPAETGSTALRPSRRSSGPPGCARFVEAPTRWGRAPGRPCPTSNARCRVWRSIAAVRATSPRSAGLTRAAALQVARSVPTCRPAGRGRAILGGRDAPDRALEAALVAEPPLSPAMAASSRPGHDEELDRNPPAARDEGRGVIAALQAEYVRLSGVNALKIRHNNVIGYHIETPAGHAAKMLAPLSETFIHRQTTASAVRFTTLPLAEMETRSSMPAATLAIEKRVFEGPAPRSRRRRAGQAAARAGRDHDVAAGISRSARPRDWVRPQVETAPSRSGGRHPWSSRVVAPAAASPPTIAISGGRRRCPADLADHRLNMAVDLPAPERPDRAARPDRRLCSGVSGPDRHRRPAFQPGRRGPTIWRAAARPSWSRWSGPRRSSTGPARARSSSLGERSAGEPRPMTGSRSLGGARASPMTPTAAASSPRIITS